VSESPTPQGSDPAREDALDEHSIRGDWLSQFQAWLDDAVAAGLVEPTAMVLATADAEARPSARMVLMKGVDERGFTFYSNRESRKGRDLAVNQRASLVFPWHAIHRQVIVAGPIAVLDEHSSDEYFASRAYGSQISAHASRQSRVIADREVLEAARESAEASYPREAGAVPRPAWWGGWLLEPETVEFWQGRMHRLHDRLRFRRERDGWILERLSP
jgi:pyridoxamine 5'-phosphate oxidase